MVTPGVTRGGSADPGIVLDDDRGVSDEVVALIEFDRVAGGAQGHPGTDHDPEVPGSPGAELGQYRDELDRGFGEAVCGPLSGAGVVAGEQPGVGEPPEAVGKDVGGDLLLRAGEQLAEVAAVAEHHVPQHPRLPVVKCNWMTG
jgi:hypothetical protein